MSASRTKRNSKCSKYRRPPWISLLDALEVEEARSSFSQRYTDQPRPAASLAIPQPLTPPPMTAMSKVAPGGAEDSTVPPPSRSAQSHRPFEKCVFRLLRGYNERVAQGKRKNELSNEYIEGPA